jgi:hypothetical protein
MDAGPLRALASPTCWQLTSLRRAEHDHATINDPEAP